MWTPPKLVKWISKDFEQKGFPPPHRFQAEQIVSHALEISRLDIYLQFDKPCTPEEQKAVRNLIKRRYRREPTAYILGQQEFWSLNLDVGPGVLIPRQDTEILVESILEKIQAYPLPDQISILELGTGTAAIPLALASECTDLMIVSIELSRKALEFATRNLEKYSEILKAKNNRIVLVHGDGFQSINKKSTFDFIISNPPYIPNTDINTLQEEVKDWEPGMALNGGNSGTDFFERMIRASKRLLKTDGYLIFEHGFDQFQPITDLLEKENRLMIDESRKDYAGHDRVMILKRYEPST